MSMVTIVLNSISKNDFISPSPVTSRPQVYGDVTMRNSLKLEMWCTGKGDS